MTICHRFQKPNYKKKLVRAASYNRFAMISFPLPFLFVVIWNVGSLAYPIAHL